MEVQQAIREKNTDLEVIDPQQGQGRKFLAIASLENLGWSVIVERSWNDTFQSEYSSFAGIAAIATLVFLFITAFINYQYSLHSKAQNLLETERQLRQSETRYKHLLENIPDILYTYSSVHAGIYFSPQVEAVLGYSSDYLRNHPALWHDSIHPDDLPEVNRAIENSIAGRRIQLEYRIRDAHGQWHWLHDRSVNIANEVGETLISGLASDITERKQLEEVLRNQSWRLESIIEGTHVGTWEWNVQTGDVILNELWAQMIGFTLAELAPISIKTWTTFAHPDDFKQSAELLKKHFAGELPFYNYECRMKHKDGHWIWVLDRGRVITRTDDGQPLLMFGTHTDITESKKLEEQQRNWEQQRLRIQKVESLKIMAGAIAHHFNNQLGAVIGNLEMALEDLRGDAAPVKILADAMKAARKAAEISEHMLTYLGQTTGIHEPLDLSETCRHSLSLLQATAPKGLSLKVELLSPGPTISANSNQIQQVLTNIVTNAWEAVADTEGSVFLTVKMASPLEIAAAHRFPADWQPQDEISYACLEVVDTGCGIAEEDINKLFDPFFSTKFSGRGLGLPVVFGIVNAHHGSVIVESEIGRGSTFRVLLPVSAEELPQQLKTIQPLAANGSGTILLVDDDDLLRQMAATRLIRLGYEVIETKNGLEAMEMFRLHQEKICCVLTDLTMPFMDGWEVLAAVRKLSPDMPVILSSGYDEAKVKTIFDDHHELPQVFLHKPYQKAELQSALAKAMGAA